MQRITVTLTALVLVMASCSSGPSQEEYDTLQAELASTVENLNAQISSLETARGLQQEQLATEIARADLTQEDLDAAQGLLEEANADVTTLSQEVGDNRTRIAQIEGALTRTELDLGQAEEDRDDALAQLEALILAYNPEIQAAKVQAQAEMMTLVCETARDWAQRSAGRPTVRNLVAAEESTYPGFDLEDFLDFDSLETELTRCWDAEVELVALAELQAELTSPKGSGFYTVGDEIAVGRWRSTGTGDGCYWARLDANQGILDNHFGSSGGTVTIRSSDYEVEFDDCGTWEYLA